MTVSEVIKKMVAYSEGNLHDINHFMKVYAYAKTIAEGENLNPELQKLVEVTAVVHDIACPLCRVKYGNTNGKHQEEESAALLEEFFKDSDLPKEFTDRVSYIVSHHHTIDGIDGIDYQIMIEADYLVNADESNFSGNNVRNMLEKSYVPGERAKWEILYCGIDAFLMNLAGFPGTKAGNRSSEHIWMMCCSAKQKKQNFGM